MRVKKIVGVFANPDDEIRIMGLLLRAQSMGIKTHIIYTTSNKFNYDEERFLYNESRLTDQLEGNYFCDGFKVSELSSVYFLDILNKNKFILDSSFCEKKLSRLVKKINPDVIITYEKDRNKAPVIHNSICEVTTKVFDKINVSRNKRLYHITNFPRNLIEDYIDTFHYPRLLKSRIIETLSKPDDQVSTLIKLNNDELEFKLKRLESHIARFKDEKEICYGLPLSIYKKLIIYECLSINESCVNVNNKSLI
ncbi:MAG: hypothetical protein AB6733_11415 [Clostridiaceae bacterium]